MSRSQNSIKNIITSNISQVLIIVLNFIVRTVFVRTLGMEYLGLSGLFTNILTVLSLADMGLGNAIIFKLYKPIEEKNERRIIALMKLYRKMYTCIGCIVAFLGVCVAPFLKYIIKDYDTFGKLGLNPVIILLLYVLQTASSYWFFAYKQSMVYAHQKTYLLTVKGYIVSVISAMCQIAVLVFWNNFFVDTFIAYTCVIILFSIIQNLVYARVADKYFPYLRSTTDEKISKEEIREILKDCGALFIYKADTAVISATDNIALSAMLNLATVGLYSNYRLIYTNIKNVLMKVMDSVGASVGSIHATGKLEWKRTIFRTINLATVILFGVISVPLAVVGDEFISLWIGDKFLGSCSVGIFGSQIKLSLAALIGIELYLYGMTLFLSKFRNGFGLFRQLKVRPVIGMIINLALTILLIPYLGASGTVISTIAAYAFTTCIFDPIVIIKHELHTSKVKYFMTNLLYSAVTVGAYVLSYLACSAIHGSGILFFIIHGFVSVFITGAVYIICFGRTETMRELLTFLPKNKLIKKICKLLFLPV